MSKNIMVASLIFIFAITAFSQVDISVFNDISGTWQAIYPTGFEEYMNKETLVCKWIHNHNFFQMDIAGEVEGHFEFGYSSTGIFTLDDKDNIKGWVFNEDGYRSILTYKGKVEGSKVIMEGTNPDYSYKQTLELKEGKLINKRELKISGKDPSVFEVVYTRKQ